jgi:hypothetical protein
MCELLNFIGGCKMFQIIVKEDFQSSQIIQFSFYFSQKIHIESDALYDNRLQNFHKNQTC